MLKTIHVQEVMIHFVYVINCIVIILILLTVERLNGVVIRSLERRIEYN